MTCFSCDSRRNQNIASSEWTLGRYDYTKNVEVVTEYLNQRIQQAKGRNVYIPYYSSGPEGDKLCTLLDKSVNCFSHRHWRVHTLHNGPNLTLPEILFRKVIARIGAREASQTKYPTSVATYVQDDDDLDGDCSCDGLGCNLGSNKHRGEIWVDSGKEITVDQLKLKGKSVRRKKGPKEQKPVF